MTTTDIHNRQEEVNLLHAEVFKSKKTNPKPKPANKTLPSSSDYIFLQNIFASKNGDKIQRLYNGDISDYPSPSEADQALCNALAFWFGKDAGQMDSVFRTSGLFRPKWDEKHFSDGRTYGQATIDTAIAGTSETYQGKQYAGSSSSAGKSEPEKQNIISLNISDFLNLNLPKREFIIDPILPQQGLASVYAPRGMGKTYFLITLGAAVATGQPTLYWKTPAARRVLYIDGEMPARTMQERIAHILSNFGEEINPDYFKIITPDLNPEYTLNLSREADQESIDGFVTDADLIIIDSLSTLARHGEENRAESWLPVQEYLLKLRRRGKSVIFAHHAGKNGQQRGTSAKEDILDTVIALKRPKDYREEEGARFEVKFEKARGICGDDVKSFEAKLEQDGDRLFWTCRDIEDVRLDQVKELHGEGMTVREIAEEMGLSKSSVHRLIKKL